MKRLSALVFSSLFSLAIVAGCTADTSPEFDDAELAPLDDPIRTCEPHSPFIGAHDGILHCALPDIGCCALGGLDLYAQCRRITGGALTQPVLCSPAPDEPADTDGIVCADWLSLDVTCEWGSWRVFCCSTITNEY